MKDAIGQEINVGDSVLYADVSDGRVDFEEATITRFTKVCVGIEYVQKKWNMGRAVTMLTSTSRIVKRDGPTKCEYCGHDVNGEDE